MLFWESIKRAKDAGIQEFDLGRSELVDHGLVQFKERLGATRSTLTYYRYPAQPSESHLRTWAIRAARYTFAHMPESLLVPVGNLLYRHLG